MTARPLPRAAALRRATSTPALDDPNVRSGVRRRTSEARRKAVELAIDEMYERYAEPLSVLSLARVAMFSPYHFDRFFGEITGVPPLRFLSAIRIQRAKQLLLLSQYSVTRISGEVGYNSLGTFTRQFSDYVGVAPGRFRSSAEYVGRICGKHAAHQVAREPKPGAIQVRVEAPESFSGGIFIGVFPSAIPRSRPLACSLVQGSGTHGLPAVPDGRYYLLAVGIRSSAASSDMMLCVDAPRGRAGPVRVADGRVARVPRLVLRPPALTDPPLLLALPFVLAERLDRAALPERGVAASGPLPEASGGKEVP